MCTARLIALSNLDRRRLHKLSLSADAGGFLLHGSDVDNQIGPKDRRVRRGSHQNLRHSSLMRMMFSSITIQVHVILSSS